MDRTQPDDDAVEKVLLGEPFDDPEPDPRLSIDIDHYLYGASRLPLERH